MAACRTCCVHDTFQFQRGDDIFALAVCILIVVVQFDDIKSGGNDDCAVFFCYDLVFLIVVDRTCLTYFRTYTTFSGFELDTVFTVDHRYVRDCLSKWCVDRASVVQTAVEFARCFLGWTFFLTYATSGTFVHVDASCFFPDIYGKVTNETRYFFYFTVCINMNFFVSCSFHHLWCQDTCRTVQSREGFVQLGHSSADTWLFLNDIYFITCICNIQSCLDTCDTATDNQCTFCYKAFARLQWCVQVYFCYCCSHQDHSFFCCLFHIFMDPGTMFTDVGNFYHVWVQSGSLSCFPECCLMHTWGTGTDYQSCQLFFFDRFCDQGLSGFGTHILIVFCMNNTRLHKSHLCYSFHVYRCCDITSAMTDKYSYSLHQGYLLYLLNALTNNCCGSSGSSNSGISSGVR